MNSACMHVFAYSITTFFGTNHTLLLVYVEILKSFHLHFY